MTSPTLSRYRPAAIAARGVKVRFFTDSGCTTPAAVYLSTGQRIPDAVLLSDPISGALSEVYTSTGATLYVKQVKDNGPTYTPTGSLLATLNPESQPAAEGSSYVPRPGAGDATGSVPTKQSDGSIAYAVPSGGGGAVSSVAGKTGAVSLVKGDVGLGNVDNTADASKPVSTAQAAAIAAAAGTSVTDNGNGTATVVPGAGGGGGGAAAPTLHTTAASGATLTLADLGTSVGDCYDVTLTANCTITLPTLAACSSFVLRLTQGGSGGFSVTWPGTVKWSQAIAPVLSTVAGKQDLIVFQSVAGTAWNGGLFSLDSR